MNRYRQAAQEMQRYGRNGDTILAHINPREAQMLKRQGGSGTRNPITGAFEFFELGREDRDDIAAMFGYQGPGGGAAPGSIQQYMQQTGQTEAFQRAKADAAAQQAQLGVNRGGYGLTPSAYGIGEGSAFQPAPGAPQMPVAPDKETPRIPPPSGGGQFDYQGFLDNFFNRFQQTQQTQMPSFGAGYGYGGMPYGAGYYPSAAFGYGAFGGVGGQDPYGMGTTSTPSYQNTYTGFGDFYSNQQNPRTTPRGGFEPAGAFNFT